MNLKTKIAVTTFSLFMLEAIMPYNQGKKDCVKEEKHKGFLPPTKSLIKLGLIVGTFSIINGIIVDKIK